MQRHQFLLLFFLFLFTRTTLASTAAACAALLELTKIEATSKGPAKLTNFFEITTSLPFELVNLSDALEHYRTLEPELGEANIRVFQKGMLAFAGAHLPNSQERFRDFISTGLAANPIRMKALPSLLVIAAALNQRLANRVIRLETYDGRVKEGRLYMVDYTRGNGLWLVFHGGDSAKLTEITPASLRAVFGFEASSGSGKN